MCMSTRSIRHRCGHRDADGASYENSIIWRHGQSVANSQKLEVETARATAAPAAMGTSQVSPLLHHVVIVGGGAAGLELATKLGDRLYQLPEIVTRGGIPEAARI